MDRGWFGFTYRESEAQKTSTNHTMPVQPLGEGDHSLRGWGGGDKGCLQDKQPLRGESGRGTSTSSRQALAA
jgi:hypothetical protein